MTFWQVLNRQILRKWLAEAPENHAPEAISDVLAELSHGPSLKTRLREDLRQKLGNIEDLPESFDARQKWKHCKHLIGAVHNQGPCKSDYVRAKFLLKVIRPAGIFEIDRQRFGQMRQS